MKSQTSTTASLYSVPAHNFGILAELFAAMPIVIFFKAVQAALAQPNKTAR